MTTKNVLYIFRECLEGSTRFGMKVRVEQAPTIDWWSPKCRFH